MTTRAATVAVRTILETRARKLAQKPDQRRIVPRLGTFAIVAVGSREVGLPVADLREIVRTPAVTPLPNLPAHLRGIALVRGDLLSIVDLGRLYELPETPLGRYLAVLTDPRGAIGLLVDRVVGFREIDADEVAGGAVDPAAHGGFASRGTTRDLVTLLDVPRLFLDERLIVDTSEKE